MILVALIEQQSVPPSTEVESRWEAARREVTGRLALRHDRVDVAFIEAIVARHFDAYADARITLYVPLLVERAAGDELRRLSAGEASRRQ